MNPRNAPVASRTRAQCQRTLDLQKRYLKTTWEHDQCGWAEQAERATTNEQESRFAFYWYRSKTIMEQEIHALDKPNYNVVYPMPRQGQRW